MRYWFLGFLGILVLMPSFAGQVNAVKQKQQLITTDFNRILVVPPEQDEIEIVLPSNPTTGYVWAVKDFDRDLLNLHDHFVFSNTNDKKLGMPILERFEFKLIKNREANQLTEITFTQLRHFDAQEQVNNEITFKVMIYAN